MILELYGVRKMYNLGAERIEALSRVDLALEDGEFVTVIGSNGAGKSTLLNIIAGTARPTAGRVRITGRDMTSWPAHRRAKWIGRVFQNPAQGTAARLTVAENLALARHKGRRGLRLALTASDFSALRKKVARLDMNLDGRLSERVEHLSGGERQALAVLMATLASPKLLLLDEHTASLDPANAERVVNITEELVREQGITTIMVTHRMDQALAVGDRLIMVHKGRIFLDLAKERKRCLGVNDLIALFQRAGATDDELLLNQERVGLS